MKVLEMTTAAVADSPKIRRNFLSLFLVLCAVTTFNKLIIIDLPTFWFFVIDSVVLICFRLLTSSDTSYNQGIFTVFCVFAVPLNNWVLVGSNPLHSNQLGQNLRMLLTTAAFGCISFLYMIHPADSPDCL
jgi:hypothetical protein